MTSPAQLAMPCTAERHGDRDAYRRARCRCTTARHAMARYENERRLDALSGKSRTLSNIGALRRLHALRALGWSARELADRIGVDERNIARWPHRTFISRSLHNAICRVYDELADHAGPDERARRHAIRQGWLPPKWWDEDLIDDPAYQPPTAEQRHCSDVDPVAVERACAGDSMPLTRGERISAILHLHSRGLNQQEIARQLRISDRNIGKTIARHREQVAS